MKKSIVSTAFALIILSNLVSGCGPAATTTAPATVASTPVVATQALAPQTTAPATAAAPKGASISANGVEFVIPASLGNSANAAIIPEYIPDGTGPSMGAIPVYYRFTLPSLQGGGIIKEATISVYPAKEYALINELAARNINKLKAIIAASSAPLTHEAMPAAVIPAALDVAANMKLITFQGGSGVRLLAHYGQGPMPISSQDMLYQFHGLTTDGKYYVLATLPINAPSLQGVAFPDLNSRDTTALTAALKNYWNQISERLNTAEKDNTLAPSITLFDAFMQSIKLNEPKIVQPAPTLARPTTGPAINSTASSATSCGDGAFFQKDLTIPDGTVLKPNEKFTKRWELKNIGTCSWTPNYLLVFQKGDPLGSPTEVPLTGGNVTVASGSVFAPAIEFKAPATAGTYRSYWSIKNAAGKLLPIEFYVEIKVVP